MRCRPLGRITMLSKLEETLFIDDREVNVKAAEAMGIHGIQFKSLPQLRQELEAEGFPVLPPAAKTPPTSANN